MLRMHAHSHRNWDELREVCHTHTHTRSVIQMHTVYMQTDKYSHTPKDFSEQMLALSILKWWREKKEKENKDMMRFYFTGQMSLANELLP